MTQPPEPADPPRPTRGQGRIGPWARFTLAAVTTGALLFGATLIAEPGWRLSADTGTSATPSGALEATAYVESAVLACPGALDADMGALAAVAASAPLELFPTLPPGDGQVETHLTGTGQPDTSEPAAGTDRGQWWAQDAAPAGAAGAVQVQAQGALTPGVVAAQLTYQHVPDGRGLSLTPCTAAADVLWLAGGGPEAGRAESIMLTNPGADAITVALEVWGSEGPIALTGATGLVVPAQGRSIHRLDALAPGVDTPVIKVSAHGGPVVAHLTETFREGTVDRGRQTGAALADPDTDLVIPALPVPGIGDDSERELVLRLFAPGSAEALVELRALTETGAQSLDDVIRVPGGQVVQVPLENLPAGAVALRLRSDEPVTAAARLQIVPDDEPLPENLSTAAPASESTDNSETTATAAPPDDQEATATASPSAPADDEDESSPLEQEEPIRHRAGELTWIGAVRLSTSPIGIAIPHLDQSGDEGMQGWEDHRWELAVSVVDSTDVRLVTLSADGEVGQERLSLPHDTTALLDIDHDLRAIWVLPQGPDSPGLAASVHVAGADPAGPYLAAAGLTATPWQQQVSVPELLLP